MTPPDENRQSGSGLDRHLSDDAGADLVHGLLPPDVERAWIEHLRGCVPCESRFRELAEVFERGRARYPVERVAADAPGAAWSVLRGESLQSRSGALRRWLGIGLGLAAAAALVLVFRTEQWGGPRFEAGGPRADQPWLPVDGEERVQLRSDGSALSESLRLALGAYGRHDLSTARVILQRVQSKGPDDQVRRIFLADVLYRQGEPGLAVTTLDPVDFIALPDPWRSRAYRTLMLGLEATGERDRVDALRSRLAGDPGEIGAFVRSLDRTSPRR